MLPLQIGKARHQRAGDPVDLEAEQDRDLEVRRRRAQPVRLEDQLGLEPGGAAQAFQHLLDEERLDAQQLALGQQQAGQDLVARADDAALVRGAILDHHDAGVEELAARLLGEEQVGPLDDQPAGRAPVGVHEPRPVGAVDGLGTAAGRHEHVGDDAVVQVVAQARPLGIGGAGHPAFGGQPGRVEGDDRSVLTDQPQELARVEAARILGAAEPIGDADDLHVRAELTDGDLDLVAGDVAVGAAGELEGEGLSPRVDADRPQRHLEEDVQPLAGDAELLVVDAGVGLGAHERRRRGVAAVLGARDDPLDVRRRDVLVRAEVDRLGLAQPIDDRGARRRIGGDEIEDGVCEGPHARRDVARGVDQQHRLGAPLGDVLVLELLGPGQAVGLIEVALALAQVLFGRRRPHDAHAAARGVAEAHVKGVEAATVDPEHPVGNLRPGSGAHDQRRGQAQRQRIPAGHEVVGLQGRPDRLQHGRQHRAGQVVLDPLLDLARQRGGEIGALQLRQRRLCGIEARQEEADQLGRQREVTDQDLLDPRPRIEVAVGLDQQLMDQAGVGHQDVGAAEIQHRLAVTELKRLGVEPLQALEIAGHAPPERRARIDRLAGRADHDRRDDHHRLFGLGEHGVDVGARDVDGQRAQAIRDAQENAGR